MKAPVVLYLIRLILCNDKVKNFLIDKSLESETPFDDFLVDALYNLLEGK